MNHEWKADYQAFSSDTVGSAPPPHVSRAILDLVRKDLNPATGRVFGKLVLIHAAASSLTLTVCPQFGVGPLGGGHGVMGLFMQYGPGACAAACGFVFMSLTVVAANALLRPEELRVTYRSTLATFSALAILSVMALLCLGTLVQGEAVDVHPNFVLPWVAAAVLSAAGLHWVLARVRQPIPARS